jgi:hypothetical protein
MATGEPGVIGALAVLHAEVELNQEVDLATTLHLPMVVPFA